MIFTREVSIECSECDQVPCEINLFLYEVFSPYPISPPPPLIVAGNAKTKAALAELSQKSVLLSANSVKCKETVRVLNEFSRRIRQRVELFR